MRSTSTKRSLTALAGFAAAVLFALCVLCVLLSGAGVYRRLTADGQQAYARRTCAQYITTRVRQSENAAALAVESFGGVSALTVTQTIGSEVYLTRVYCYQGWLMELFSHREGEFSPADGEKLLPAQSLTFSLNDGLLQATVVDEFGRQTALTFALRGGEGGQP